ncbi:phage holin family protein [Tessaracoccus sp. OS52]|uniref:phage holin family protein n=1 Tax=Tessaracoccus sp. OS52 TaxID=2886691 RepID=UPI001D10E01A|nr:phage holin family protein [Tessaracoccus sp. OS52]MCC2592552.1 phage holin family protein [Tessaracoccus sp. OS52]
MQLVLKLIAGALATALAVWLVPGITITASDSGEYIFTLLAVAAILGVVNAVVKPFAKVVGFCLIVLTLGLFLVVINALMLLLVSWLSAQLGLGFAVDGFWPALFGSIIITIATALVGGIFGVNDKKS